MRIAILSAATVAFFALIGGAAAWEPEGDQIAQQKMIGLSKKKILACMGAPAHRLRVGATEIWTYPLGAAVVEGGIFSPGLNGMASFFGGADAFCNVNVVTTNGAASQVYYSAPDGGPLRLGEQCLFKVQNCEQPWVVRARY
jgi:hypothetical protein